jgi:hypothetical protein
MPRRFSDRRDNAELGKVCPDRIDHRGLLADEQMASAVKHQAALLFRRLCQYETHIGSGDRLADSLCISHVILLPFDIGLHIGWRHQSHGMPKRLKFARPMVRRGAGLNAHQAWWQLLKERQNRPPLQLTTDDHLATSVNTVNLKHRLGDIETDCRYRLHGSLL